MKTSHFRGALLIALSVVVQPGCGGRGGSQDFEPSVGGSSSATTQFCEPGTTRECVGPGACPGGQECSTSGFWGPCECAETGGTPGITTTWTTTSQTSGGRTATGGSTSSGTHTGGTKATGGSWNFTGGRTSVGGSGGTNSHPVGGAGGVGGQTTGVGGRTTGGFGGTAGTTGTTVGGTGAGGTKPSGGSWAGGSFPMGGTTATGGTTYFVGGYPPIGGTSAGGTTNHPPYLTSLAYYPQPITKNDTLYIYAQATDPDNDKITYSYAWWNNGKSVGYNSWLLSSYWFSRGDSITVTVTPNDGKTNGESVTSEPIIVANAPPTFGSWPTITPWAFADGDTALNCSGTATDADGDTLKYAYNWYNSGTQSTYHDSTLPASATSVGDLWSCEVLASDGFVTISSSTSDTTTINTTVSGIYRSDTTWTAANSPYYLTGRVQFAPNATLTIEPGVVVYGNGYNLEFWGNVQAVGTAEKPIYIEGLNVYDNSTADKPGKFTMAYVEYADGSLLGSATAATVNISDSVLRNLQASVYLPPGVSTPHRLERNLFAGDCGIYSNGPLVLNSNSFAYTQYSCVDVQVVDSVDASGNNFYAEDLYRIVVVVGAKSVDLTNSYWGSVYETDVPTIIRDTNDDLSIDGEVKYLPTLKTASSTAPLPDKTYFPNGI